MVKCGLCHTVKPLSLCLPEGYPEKELEVNMPFWLKTLIGYDIGTPYLSRPST